MKLTELLEQIDRLDQEATKGPWTTDSTPDEFGIIWGSVEQIGGGFGERAMVTEIMEEHADAEFIALARTVLPQLAKALQAVMEIHKPFHTDHYYNGMDGESLHRFVLRCDGCEESGGIEGYPCPTVSKILEIMDEV